MRAPKAASRKERDLGRTTVILWVLLLSDLAVPSGAQELGLREFHIERYGTLQLVTPVSWKESLKRGPRFLPPKILFSPASGGEFLIQISPASPQTKGLSRDNPEEIRKRVEQTGHRLLSRALEANLTLQELTGKAVLGFYFSLTDKAPKPREFKYLTQGIAMVLGLPLEFMILYNDPEDSRVRAALEMLSQAYFIPGK